MENCMNYFQPAYLCVKSSLSDNLLSKDELKHALQCIGKNPSPNFIDTRWGEKEFVDYELFCKLSEQLPDSNMDDIYNLVISVFEAVDDKVDVETTKSTLFSMGFSGKQVDEILTCDVVENGLVNCLKLSHSICKTVDDLRELSIQNYENSCKIQRINSLTFTRKKKLKNNRSISSVLKFENWFSKNLKGCFYLDKQNIIAHQYCLELTDAAMTVIAVFPQKDIVTTSGRCFVDTLAFIFMEDGSGGRNYIGFTSKKELDSTYYYHNFLKEGKYVIIPFTSGCRLQHRSNISSSAIDLVYKTDRIELSSAFLTILRDIFNQIDLDGNGKLNRLELNLYIWRTIGHQLTDEDWLTALRDYSSEEDELTFKGFLDFHQFEAEDNSEDPQDLWIYLKSMGYNKLGMQDEAASFNLSIYSETCEPQLNVIGLNSGGVLLNKALLRSIMESSDPQEIEHEPDLIKFVYQDMYRGAVIIQNKSNQTYSVHVDCSNSINCKSSRKELNFTLDLAEKSAIIVHHFVPEIEDKDWCISCIIKLV